MRADLIKRVLCGLWFIILVAGLNSVLTFINSGILILVFLFFLLADLVLPKFAIVIKIVLSLLLVHRNYYIGSFFDPSWLTWLRQDVGKDLLAISKQGLVIVEPVTAMVLTLAAVMLMQTLFSRIFLRGRGITLFLCLGTALLSAAYIWQGDGSVWYVIFYVIFGLIIKATAPLEIGDSFPIGRWLWNLLVWVLVLTSVSWALPDPGLDFGNWLGEGVAWKYDPFAPPRGRVGYSVFDEILGGPLEEDETPALLVTSPVPVYLRGETRWQYTGKGWRVDSVIQEPVPKLAPKHLEGKEIEIIVEVLAPAEFVFAPRYPLNIEADCQVEVFYPAEVGQVFPYEDYQYNANLRAGDQYRLTALLPADDPDVLRQLPNTGIDSSYLSLENVSDSVQKLALSLVEEETNGYDKAVALASFLRYGWDYSLDTLAPAADEDFVENFLFKRRTGYCVHFSTAFVVMARSVGLPARWVKGYSYGAWEDGKYLVRNSHAHSWAEVWFEGYGWVPFEPTPGGAHLRTEVGVTDPDVVGPSTPIPEDKPDPNPGPEKPEPHKPDAKKPGNWWAYAAGGAGLILIAAFVLLLWSGRGGGIREIYARLQTRLRLFGWQRRQWETPREHLNRVDSLPDRPRLTGFVRQFEDSVYGGAEEPAKQERRLGKHLSLLGLFFHRITHTKRHS